MATAADTSGHESWPTTELAATHTRCDSMAGGRGGGGSAAALRLVTEVLETIGRRESAHPALCSGVARALHSRAAAHASLDMRSGAWSLCLWRQEQAVGVATVVVTNLRQEPPPRPPSDWWTQSPALVMVQEWLRAGHVADLPLASGPTRFSVLRVGRDEPYQAEDHRWLVHARRAVVAAEAVVEILPAPRPGTDAAGDPTQRDDANGLSKRELQVLTMVGDGLLARSIAQRLDVSERTVHKHLGNVYRKLDVHDRLLAVRRAESLGLLPAPRVGDALEPRP